MKLNCLVVDDEPLALNVLTNYISQLPFLNLVQTCRSASAAFSIMQTQQVDLLFLDIEMPLLSGLDFVRSLDQPPKIIFTTAYRDYAVESYEANAVDYLLKPVSFERFLKALNKASTLLNTPTKLAPEPSQNHFLDDTIYIKADKKVFRVVLGSIQYIESFKDYLIVHTAEGERIQTYQPISNMERMLPTDRFIRIHRSFIVSLAHIHSFSATWVRVGELELPIGRQYKEHVQQLLQE